MNNRKQAVERLIRRAALADEVSAESLELCGVTPEMIMAAIESDDCIGFCAECGEEAYEVEPDARQYKCESCGALAVYGAEELLFFL